MADLFIPLPELTQRQYLEAVPVIRDQVNRLLRTNRVDIVVSELYDEHFRIYNRSCVDWILKYIDQGDQDGFVRFLDSILLKFPFVMHALFICLSLLYSLSFFAQCSSRIVFSRRTGKELCSNVTASVVA